MNNHNLDKNFSLVFDTDEDTDEDSIKQSIAAILPPLKEKTVEILIGPSGSGKTTYALRQKWTDPTIIIMASDELTKTHEKWSFIYRELYDQEVAFAKLVKYVKLKTTKFMQYILHLLCATDRNIIIDRTNMSAKERESFIRVAKAYGYTVIAHEMQISRELAYQRIRKRRNHPTLKQNKIRFALSDQYGRYETANAQEGFDKIKVTVQH